MCWYGGPVLVKFFTSAEPYHRDGRMPSAGTREANAVLAPRNYLHVCLLLLIAESPAHGYDIVERLSDLWF